MDFLDKDAVIYSGYYWALLFFIINSLIEFELM